MNQKIPPIVCGLLLLAANPTSSLATPLDNTESEADILIAEIINAKPLNRVAPKYPISAARNGQEGWTTVSFIIEKDGSVSSPIIEDSSGNKKFNKETLKALKKWQYQPATENGVPVQQCNQSVRMDFSLAGDGTGGATRRFVSKYKDISQLILDKDLDSAKTAMDKLKAKPRWNLYEDGWFANLQAAYYRATGDKQQHLASLSRLISAKKYIPQDMRLNALVEAFSLNIQLKNYADALSNYKKMAKMPEAQGASARVKPYVDKINALVEGDVPIIKSGTIGTKSIWHHQLVRNSFGLKELQGELHKMEVRCQNKVFTYQVRDDKAWNIPEKWGKCNVYVHGEENSSFKQVELSTHSKAI